MEEIVRFYMTNLERMFMVQFHGWSIATNVVASLTVESNLIEPLNEVVLQIHVFRSLVLLLLKFNLNWKSAVLIVLGAQITDPNGRKII